MPHCRWAIAIALIVAVVTTSAANAATYSVTFAAGDSGWSSTHDAGFAIDGWHITTSGPVTAGSGAALLFQPDTPNIRIASGQLTGHFELASASATGRVQTIDAGAASDAAVIGSTGTQIIDITHAADAVSIGVRAANAVGAGAATMDLIAATFQLDDTRVPTVISATASVDAAANCTRITVIASDAESGLASITLRDRRALVTLTSWTSSRTAGMHPGASSTSWQPCLDAAALANGIGFLDVDVVDASGQHVHSSVTASSVAAISGGAVALPPSPNSANSTAPLSLAPYGAVPARAVHGMRIRISARVTRAGTAVANREVQLRGAGGSVLATARTNSSGIASLSGTSGAGPLTLSLTGTNISAPLRTHVSPRVSWGASSRAVLLNGVAQLRGVVRPANACKSVTLRARRGAGWFVVRSGVRCTADGSFAIPVTANARGTFRLQAQVRTRTGWWPGSSAIRVLRVR